MNVAKVVRLPEPALRKRAAAADSNEFDVAHQLEQVRTAKAAEVAAPRRS